MRNIFIIIIAIFLLPIPTSVAKEVRTDSTVTERFAIYYRFDKTDIQESYLDNPGQFERIIRYLNESPRIDSITIYSWASPEGAYRHNVWLSRERGKSVHLQRLGVMGADMTDGGAYSLVFVRRVRGALGAVPSQKMHHSCTPIIYIQ